jgi:hypothetical protein
VGDVLARLRRGLRRRRQHQGISENVDQHHDMRRLCVCPRCRAGRLLTMHHAALYASRPVDGMSTIINGTITAAGWVSYVKPPIYFGSFGALGGFVFWVALIWFGTCGKAAAPSIESDLFNPSIPRVRRTKDGGFDAVVPRGPIFADSLTGDGSDAKSPREQRHLASH